MTDSTFAGIYVTTGEAARMLGVSLDTVREYLDAGTLAGHRLPSGDRRIRVDSVRAILEAGDSGE